MSESTPPPMPEPEPDLEILAMEQVLGLLGPEEEAALAARFGKDARFAAALAKWERNCAPLLLEVPEATAPAEGWRGLSERLGFGGPRLVVASPERRGWWNDVALWRGAAGAALAAAAVAVFALTARPPAPTAAPESPLVAALAPESGFRDAGVATYYPAVHRLVIAAAITPPPGKAAELWLIPEGGTALSIGFIDGGEVALTLAAAHAALVRPGAKLAVTIEPPGGAPGGKATGPVVSAGALHTL